jgi:hypothetical protein
MEAKKNAIEAIVKITGCDFAKVTFVLSPVVNPIGLTTEAESRNPSVL